MRTEREFWDDALLAALTALAGQEAYGTEFPDALIEDATRIADAACEARDKRLPAFPDMLLRGDTRLSHRYVEEED